MATVLTATEKNLGEFSVKRILPHAQQQMIGPFIFFDHFGLVTFPAGRGVDVRPHPHIGIATITYLFEGSVLHRDSLGCVQEIVPGDINWMVAGKGIVHSERETEAVNQCDHSLHGLQLWIALPDGQEEIEPLFAHHARDTLPAFGYQGVRVTLMVGDLWQHQSPVQAYSDMVYADLVMPEQTDITLPAQGREYGCYVIAGSVLLNDTAYRSGDFVYISVDEHAHLQAQQDSQVVVIGGHPFNSERHVWWNFVSSSRERIEQAKHDWQTGDFGSVPGDEEFIPLPR